MSRISGSGQISNTNGVLMPNYSTILTRPPTTKYWCLCRRTMFPKVKTLKAESLSFILGVTYQAQPWNTFRFKDAIPTNLPWFTHKKHFDHEDLACVNASKRIETIYNKIRQFSWRATKPFKEVELQPILINKPEEVTIAPIWVSFIFPMFVCPKAERIFRPHIHSTRCQQESIRDGSQAQSRVLARTLFVAPGVRIRPADPRANTQNGRISTIEWSWRFFK